MKISIILPAFNEEGNIFPLVRELAETMPALSRLGEIECVFVDDGSTDNTRAEVYEARGRHPELNVRLIAMARNSGLTSAMNAGFGAARGEVLVTLDTDLQNDPRDIPKLLCEVIEDRADVAIGIRANRRDTFVKRLSSKIANGIRNWATDENIVDTGCSLKVYRKEFVDRIKLFTGLHRFLPTLLKMEGARVVQIPVNHRPRVHGVAKYHLFNRLIGPLMDLFAVRWMQKRNLDARWEELDGN